MTCKCGNYVKRVTSNGNGYPEVIVCANCGDLPPAVVEEVVNPNQELLDFCVKPVEEWDEDYTHIRSDGSCYPLFFSGGIWYVDKGDDWVSSTRGGWAKMRDHDFSTETPQVISKQEWLDAKQVKEENTNMSDSKEDLVAQLEALGYEVTVKAKAPLIERGQVWSDATGDNIHISDVFGDTVIGWWRSSCRVYGSNWEKKDFEYYTLLKQAGYTNE